MQKFPGKLEKNSLNFKNKIFRKIQKSQFPPSFLDEVFYTLAWSYEGSSPILACGGVRSVVRAIYVNDTKLREKKFIGHTNAINEMKFHPTEPHLLLTASKDHSMRLWNIKTEICVSFDED